MIIQVRGTSGSGKSTVVRKVWKLIIGFKRYRVSNYGEVFDRKLNRNKTFFSDSDGYLWCTLLSDDGKWRYKAVHKLVLETFVGPKPDGKQGRHLDGVCTNNRLTNLEYGTPKQNSDDKRKHGRMVEGEKQWMAKLDEEAVRSIRQRYENKECSQGQLAREYGVCLGAIQHITHYRNWKHIK